MKRERRKTKKEKQNAEKTRSLFSRSEENPNKQKTRFYL